jgi:hypothetical protein
MLDPARWALPDPEAVVAAMYQGRGAARRDTWVFSTRISAVDLYAYLKLRFGEPNGLAMALRDPSVDNLIHWNFTIASGTTILDIRGLDLANEVTAFLGAEVDAPDWTSVEDRLAEEFLSQRKKLHAVRERFEQWHLFVNPHHVLRTKLERQVARLRELDLRNVHVPANPRSGQELPAFGAELAKARDAYEEAMALCVDIQLAAPVFAESAVDLLTHILAKPEVRSDRRLFDDQRRRNIDVRLKGLHLICDGFAERIDGSEEPFKELMRLYDRRNDRLHGNVDPRASTGPPIYFDHRFIPLFASPSFIASLSPGHDRRAPYRRLHVDSGDDYPSRDARTQAVAGLIVPLEGGPDDGEERLVQAAVSVVPPERIKASVGADGW